MSTESFLILHGIENHRLPEHWQFWIAGRMRDRGHQVLYPGLPDPDTPSYLEWASALDDNLAAMDGDRRTVIAHSLACLLWMRRADGLDPRRRVNRLLLVSPPANEQVPSAGTEFRVEAINADAVRASASDEIRIVCSDNDPYNPAGASQLYAGPLGCPVNTLPGVGHITPDEGYGRWPSLEAWCRGATRELRADGSS